MNFNIPALLRKAFMPITSAVVAVVGYQAVFVAERPPWLLIGMILVASAGAIGGFFIFRHVRTKRAAERSSDTQVATVGLAYKEKADREEALRALQKNWKEAIEFLRESRLKKTGDPLYSLPWYMVIGEPGCGKTSAIRGARLPSFAGTIKPPETSGTKNCEWSFFEQAIVIDTAGRYAAHLVAGQDKDEWGKLLELLVKYRKKESLNGLVVAISADKLMKQAPDALENEGKNVRKRIDELMTTLGSKFPVYLQITKADLIPGLTKFCSHISAQGLDQTMGCVNQDVNENAVTFLKKAFSAIGERLKSLRLVLLGQPELTDLDADVLLLPEAISKLERGLTSYTKGAFQENPFQETPLLRGVFFSGNGTFLHDFFSKVLPADRSLFVPTRKTMRWRRDLMNIKVMSWLGLMAAFGLMMSVSFIKNLNMLRDADRAFSHLPALKGDRNTDIHTMHQRFETLRVLEKKNQSRWYSGFALNEAQRVNRTIGAKLSAQFRQVLQTPVDNQYTQGLASLRSSSSNTQFSQYIGHLVSRILLIKDRLNQGKTYSIEEKAAPPIPFLRVARGEADAETKEKYGSLYATSLRWSNNEGELRKELAWLQNHLRKSLVVKGNSPQWVVTWANSQRATPPITLRNYWGGEESSADGAVLAIFSRKNKDMIDSFFVEIEAALTDPAELRELKKQFFQWYRQNAVEAWRKFVVAFPQGVRRLKTRDDWRKIAPRMSKNENPYFTVINDIAFELEPVASTMGKDVPLWLKEIYRFREVQQPGIRFSLIGGKSGKGEPVSLSQAYAGYRKALDKSGTAISDPGKAVKATAEAFNPDPKAKPVFAEGFAALGKLNMSLKMENLNDPAVWSLISGPFDFIWDYARKEAADQLQTQWENKVLAETSGFTGPQALTALLGQEGPVMKFVKDQGAPYIAWKSGKGFYAKEAFGSIVPLTSGFYWFLNRGAKASMLTHIDNLNVSIAALSPTLNTGAKRFPHIIRLELLGSGKPQVLISKRRRLIENEFDPVEKSFHWTPSCSDVVLEIVVAGTHLVKRYPGPYGFFTFLGEFKDGRRVFTPRDFPNESKALSQLGITAITVKYRTKGAPDLDAPASVPSAIINGWNN